MFKGVFGYLQWRAGKDFHLFLTQVKVILKFCVKFQYSCSSKERLKSSDSAKKKQKPCVYELEIIIYTDTKEVSLIS